jgi:hypothetical protein
MNRLLTAIYNDPQPQLVIRDIRTAWESTPALWSALDANTYDGAPDSTTNVIGYGKTENEAIRNLRDLLGAV